MHTRDTNSVRADKINVGGNSVRGCPRLLSRLAGRPDGKFAGMRKPTIRQAEISRALKGLAAAGVEVARVEIENGKIIIITATGERLEPRSPLDKWISENARASQRSQ